MLHTVALNLYLDEVIAKCLVASGTLLKTIEPDCRFALQSLDILSVGHKCHTTQLAESLGVIAVVHRLCYLSNRAVTHTVDEQVGTTLNKHRGLECVAPIVVVSESAERSLDTTNHNGCVRK